jgi:hypothetical protein
VRIGLAGLGNKGPASSSPSDLRWESTGREPSYAWCHMGIGQFKAIFCVVTDDSSLVGWELTGTQGELEDASP